MKIELTDYKTVTSVLGCTTFKELENEYDEYIYYADGCHNSVNDHIEENISKNNFEFYFFDDWYVTLWRKY